MKRSRAAWVVLIVLGLAAGMWTLLHAPAPPSGADSAQVLRPAQDGGPSGNLLPPVAALPGRDPMPLADLEGVLPPSERPADASADSAATDPTRAIRGHVAMADHSALPAGLTVFASQQQPDPRIRSLRGMINDRSDEEGDADEDSGGMSAGSVRRWWPSDELRDQTRSAVAADGSFTIERAPQRSLWLTVDDPLVYPDPAVRVGVRQDNAELLLVRGAGIAGRVTDHTGAGVPDVSVSFGTKFDPFSVFDTSSRMAGLDVETDEDGRYVARQVPTGLTLLAVASARVHDSGHTPEGRQEVNLQSAQTELTPLQPGEQRALDLTLRPGHVVAGRVVKADGTPLASASVRLMRLDLGMTEMAGVGMAGGDIARSATSDDAGRFRFVGVTDGTWQAQLAEDRYRPATTSAVVLTAGLHADDLELLAEEGRSIAGRVVDGEGKPVAGALVQGSKAPSFTSMQANFDRARRQPTPTDADGRFVLSGFDAGEQRLRVTAEGFVAGKRDVEAGEQDVLVELAPLTTLSGIVLSTADDEPVRDFRVNLVPSGGLFDLTDMEGMGERMANLQPSRAFRDRDDGTFQIKNVLPGSYDLTFSGKGFGSTLLKDVEIEQAGRRGLIVLLPPECVVTGSVVSARDGRPVQGARVSSSKRNMLSTMTDSLTGGGAEASTDADGAFRMEGVSSERPLTLTVHHDAHRDLALPELLLRPGEQRDLGRLVLSTGAAVYGRVLDGNDRAVSGVTVMVSDAIGSTIRRQASDAAGRFRIEGLGPGTYNVMRMDFSVSMSAENPGDFMKDMVLRPVTLADNEEKEVNLAAKSPGGTRLTGRVTAASGPVGGAMLSLLPEHGGLSGLSFSSTDKDGEFEFAGVQPGKQVLYVTVLEGNSSAMSGQSSSPVSERITIGGAAEQRHDVSLPGGVLSGTVESELDGTKVPSVRVLLERKDSGRPDFGLVAAMGGRVGETYSDATGGFRFQFLPAGTYTVVAGGQNVIGMGSKGWAQTRVEGLDVLDNAAGFSVRVRVRPAGSIEGFVRSGAGAPLSGVGVWVADSSGTWLSTFSEVSTDSGGAYVVGSLQEGSWTLAFRDSTHALKLVAGVLVHEGDTVRQDVTLQPGVALQLVTGDINPNSLETRLSGPDGPVPTGLVSIGELMTSTEEGSALNLGTFAPGTYQLSVFSGGNVLLNTTVTLTGGSGAELIALSP